jgi:fatty acyl-CoA reductase
LNPITWQQFNEYGLAAWEKYPTKGLMWYPSTSFSTHPLAYKTEVSLYHYLPAYLFDTAARICGQRPFLVKRLFLLKNQDAVQKYESVSYLVH